MEFYSERDLQRKAEDGKLFQFAREVINFSSQYGRAAAQQGSSYVAANLVGPPRLYPSYGDFTEAFLLVSWSLLYC